jgi:hypothetical protein
MTKWEYNFEAFELPELEALKGIEEELNRLGKEGWQAVSVLSKTGAPDRWYVVLLKRAT